MIQNRNLRRLARRIAQRDEMRVGDFLQVKVGGDDVAEHEHFNPSWYSPPAFVTKPEVSSVDNRRKAVARGMPVRSASALSDRRRSLNENVLNNSSALAAASTV